MALLDELLTELREGDTMDMMALGASVMTAVASAVLENMGYPPEGLATVKFTIHDVVTVSVEWPELEEPDEDGIVLDLVS